MSDKDKKETIEQEKSEPYVASDGSWPAPEPNNKYLRRIKDKAEYLAIKAACEADQS